RDSILQILSFCPKVLNRNRRFDCGMRVVTDEFEIRELEVVNVFNRGIQFHLRQRTWLARELQFCLLKMICIEMQVAERVDEIAGLQIANLRDHQSEQRVARDVERHAEK